MPQSLLWFHNNHKFNLNVPKNLQKYGEALELINKINKSGSITTEELIFAIKNLDQAQINSIAIKNKDMLLSKAKTQEELKDLLYTKGLTEAQATQTAQEILNAQAKTANRAVTKLLADETFKQATATASLTVTQQKALATDIQAIATKGAKAKQEKALTIAQIEQRFAQDGLTGSTIKNTATNIANSVSQTSLLGSIKATTTALKAQAMAFLATPLGMITAVVGVAILATKVAETLSTSTKELQDQLDEAKSKTEEYKNKLGEVNNKISDNTEKLKELRAIGRDDSTIKVLEEENNQLERQRVILQSLEEDAKRAVAEKTRAILNNEGKEVPISNFIGDIASGDFEGATSSVGVGSAIKSFENGNVVQGLIQSLLFLTANPIQLFIPWEDSDNDILKNTQNDLENITKAWEDLKFLSENSELFTDFEYQQVSSRLSKEIGELSGSIGSNITELENLKGSLDETIPGHKELINQINGIQDAYVKLDALKPEFDTFEEIIDSDKYGEAKNELIELAKSGELTSEK